MNDFKQTEDGDIDLSAGDFQWKDATKQHQRDVMLTGKGEMAHAPNYGVGIADYLNENNQDDLFRVIRQELSKDGQTVNSLSLSDDGNIELDANY